MTIWMVYMAWALAIATALVMRLLWGPRCQHKWELVDKTELPSKIEVLSKHWRPAQMSMDELIKVAKVTATIVVRCNGCGHCRVIRMSNE